MHYFLFGMLLHLLGVASLSDYQRLCTDLLAKTDKNIGPWRTHNDTVHVVIRADLQSIQELVVASKFMHTANL